MMIMKAVNIFSVIFRHLQISQISRNYHRIITRHNTSKEKVLGYFAKRVNTDCDICDN